MTDIDRKALDAAAEGLRATGCKVEMMLSNVSAQGDVAAAFDEIVGRHGRLDCVFANAGVTGGPGFNNPEGGIETASLELWENCLRVNLTGAFLTMRAAAKHMKRRRSGSIVVTASVAALRASSLPSYGYHAAKAGIAQAVRVAALELGPYNVRVNAIAPGPFATGIGNGRLRTPEGADMFKATLPMARIASVEEIKGLALLLASPASSFMTGAIIPIDGGTQA